MVDKQKDLDSLVEEFERAFDKDKDASLRDYVPSPDHADYSGIVTELIRVDMELSWKAGNRKTVESYASLFPEVVSDPICFDQVVFEEYRLRTASGESVSPSDYEQKYSIQTFHWPVFADRESADKTRPDAEIEFEKQDCDLVETGALFRTQPNLAGRIDSGKLQNAHTLEETLKNRLRFAGLAILVSLVYLSILSLLNPVAKVGLFLGSSWLVWLNGICVVISFLVCVVLWSRYSIPLRFLRMLEMVLFGSVLTELSVGLVSDLFVDRELAQPIQEGQHALFHYASSWSLPYFALIVGYGVLIPSGWRRCTLVVSTIALIPVLVCTVAVVSLYGLSASFFQSFLLQMMIWMLIAAAIAIYGIRRLEESQNRIASIGKLGKYRLIRNIATGGMGEIFLAEHVQLNRRCAIKLMHPDWLSNRQLMSRFEREVQVLAGISHPNIVQFYDYGFTNDDVFYYVMEFLEGLNLAQSVTQNGPLSPGKAVEVLIHVAEALELIHRGGVVHRDIKPGNIFLSVNNGEEATKLLDFGLIKTVNQSETEDQLTQFGAIIGTPAYMSPEQASGRTVDHRSDIYCLASVGYFALTGKQIFDRPTTAEMLTAHINSKPPRFDSDIGISDEVQEILERCLSKDPASRYQSASELAQALRNSSEHSAMTTTGREHYGIF